MWDGTQHYLDPAGYYFKYGQIRGICHDFCDSQLYLMQ